MLKTLFKQLKKYDSIAFYALWKVGKSGMVKGVNKQIVEIINTENEYFDKAILFVNPEKLESERSELRKQADLFVNAYVCKKGKNVRRTSGNVLSNLLKVGGGAIGGALISALFLFH